LFRKNIALVFALFLGFIQLPFNAFHAHETDEHFVVINNPSENHHHCEIDELFCETGFNHDCEHGSHIKSEHPDCFTCEFHFVKHFIGSVQPENFCAFVKPTVYCFALTAQSNEIAISYNNRGPPLL
jgi:hypothetical protein